MTQTLEDVPDNRGKFGPYGGQFVPETLMPALEELIDAYTKAKEDADFQGEFTHLLKTYVGRPSPLTYAKRLSQELGGAQIYLKREDLNHTGAHKINNALGQALLANRMGKKRIVAETGAGQHGVGSATACALLGLECIVYMGEVDIERQKQNVNRMKLLGAEVVPVSSGSRTLKDAINEAIRDWVTNVETTHYLLGSVLGPHPYPMMVRDFQSIIGRETREQILQICGRLPKTIIACVGGGSNAMGIFHAFRDDESVDFIGVEAGGEGIESGRHAARFGDLSIARIGVLHGTKSYVMQTADGQIMETHSISAGLDYPSVGPEHAWLRDQERAFYTYATDEEALAAFQTLSKFEGIIPALESAHAVAEVLKRAPKMSKDDIIIVNLSGRGDKDLDTVMRELDLKTELLTTFPSTVRKEIMNEKIGFIGLGIMGQGMARNLLQAGFSLNIWNRTASKMDPLIELGAVGTKSPADLASKSDIIITCVSDTPDVEAVILDQDGVILGIKEGGLLIDMSTISPQTTRNISEKLTQKGAHMLDAPISGGSEGAAKGTLSIMVGGSEDQVLRAMPAFEAMGKAITHVGSIGAGQTVKLVNQILVVVTMLGVGEALLFAEAGGLDLQKTLDAVTQGAAGSWMLSNRGPQVINRDWRPGFTIDLQQKDLRLVLEAADQMGVPMLGTGTVFQLYRSLQKQGLGSDGNHALAKALENLSGLTIGQSPK